MKEASMEESWQQGCSLMLVFTALTLRDWSRLEESYANDRIRGLVKCDAGQAFAGKGKLSRFITLLGKWGLPVFSFLWFLFQAWCVVFFRKFIRTQIFKRNLSKRISGSVKDTKQVNWKKKYIYRDMHISLSIVTQRLFPLTKWRRQLNV